MPVEYLVPLRRIGRKVFVHPLVHPGLHDLAHISAELLTLLVGQILAFESLPDFLPHLLGLPGGFFKSLDR
jgi:hypothetical protein